MDRFGIYPYPIFRVSIIVVQGKSETVELIPLLTVLAVLFKTITNSSVNIIEVRNWTDGAKRKKRGHNSADT